MRRSPNSDRETLSALSSLLNPSGRVGDHAVAAFMLGAVKRLVGTAQQRIRGVAFLVRSGNAEKLQ